MDQQARISDPPVKNRPTNEFASLPLARAYIHTAREKISSFDGRELIDALVRLDRAYHQFPELMLDRSRGELLKGLRSAARDMPDLTAIPLLMYCMGLNPSCSSAATSLLERIVSSDSWSLLPPALRLLHRSRDLHWCTIKPIINVLYKQDRGDKILKIISDVLDIINITKENSASVFGDILTHLLNDKYPLGLDSGALAEAVQSARQRLSQPPIGRNEQGFRELLLAMAERFSAAPSLAPSSRHPDLAWPSGRMSFNEFLLQWPCEVELPVNVDDVAFIEEAYRAILLRGPEVVEVDQSLRLLRNSAVSRPWIIEDLLASEELRLLERRLRVIWGGQVITEPASSGEEQMPAVTWPWAAVT